METGDVTEYRGQEITDQSAFFLLEDRVGL